MKKDLSEKYYIRVTGAYQFRSALETLFSKGYVYSYCDDRENNIDILIRNVLGSCWYPFISVGNHGVCKRVVFGIHRMYIPVGGEIIRFKEFMDLSK